MKTYTFMGISITLARVGSKNPINRATRTIFGIPIQLKPEVPDAQVWMSNETWRAVSTPGLTGRETIFKQG